MTWDEIYERLNEIMRIHLKRSKEELWDPVKQLHMDIINATAREKEYDQGLLYVGICLMIVLKAIDDMDWKLVNITLGLALIYSWMRLQQEGKEQGSGD
jgi:hypothetical protein